MATQPQAPFYAPRPPDDSCWLGMPAPQQTGAIRLLTKQKMFGVGGQVPTKRWSPFFVDEPAVTWMPAFQNGPVRVTLTQTKFFGQPGQVPTRRYAPFYVDEPAVSWMPAFQNGPVRVTLTQVKFFGQPGQAPAKNWALVALQDDAAFWQGAPQRSVSITLPKVSPAISKQWLFGYDDATVWSPTLKNSSAIQILSSGGKPFSRQWRYDLDDPTWYWSFPYNSGLGVAPKPFSNIQWRFGIDDPTWVWSFGYNRVVRVAPPFTITGPARAPMYVPKPPEDPTWQFKATFNLSSTLPTGNPFFAPSRAIYNDDPAVWSGNQMVYNNIIVNAQFVPGPITVSILGVSDEPYWQWGAARNANTSVVSTTPPFIPSIWRPIADEQFWQPTILGKPLVLVTVASPFTPVVWRYNFDDSAVSWQQPAQRNIGLPLAPILNRRWTFNFTAAEEPWALTIQRDNALGLLNVRPFSLPNYGALHYDVLADVWTGKGYYNESLYPGAPIIVVGVTFQDPPFFGNMGKMMNN